MGQELLDGVPIIRIPANLRKAVHSPNPESSQSMSIFYAADAFSQAGYTVVYGGSMNTSNVMEGGIYADYHRKPQLQEQALRMIARAGLPILEDYHIEDAISLGQPVLAKNPYRHRGEQKYLLETDLQKAKFLTWIWLNSQQPHYFYENSTDAIHEQCLATIGLIYTGNYENILHWGSRRLLDWQFQEFVPSPLEHATSLRTLVDMRGNIIMGACVINPEKQTDRALAFEYGIDDSFDFALGHLAEGMGNVDTSYLLTDPHSPLFLDTRDVVSNHARGGIIVPLDGRPISNTLARNVFTEMNIDPDNPQIPTELIQISSSLGQHFRGIWPYSGLDWIPYNGTFAYLENNSPSALGHETVDWLEPGLNQSDYKYELLLQIAMNFSKVDQPCLWPQSQNPIPLSQLV